jgi:hypothetical protein
MQRPVVGKQLLLVLGSTLASYLSKPKPNLLCRPIIGKHLFLVVVDY